MALKITLTFTSGSLKDQKREFTKPTKCVIGRSRDCDIQLPATLEFMDISRHHCALDIDPPALQVRDLGSRNGTFINGQCIGQCYQDGPAPTEDASWHILKEGDELRIGSTSMRVEVSVRPEREKVRDTAESGTGLWPFLRQWMRSAVPC